MAKTDFSGVWLSSYSFHDTARNADFKSEHYVRIFQSGDRLVVETVPGKNSAYLILRLHLDDNLATGSWQEQTSPEGLYKGMIYNGAIQLIVSPHHDAMEGKWVGFTPNKEIDSGVWELSYIGEKLPDDTPVINSEKPV
jgi:hypothetical protein